MIVGVVNSDLEATVRLTVRGPNGVTRRIRAVIDTGFDGFLTLPLTTILALGLLWTSRTGAILADGSETEVDTYRGIVLWNRRPRIVDIDEAETTPLVGRFMKRLPKSTSFLGINVDEIFQGEDESDEGHTNETSFDLEFQLRDFIAQNISAIDVNGKRLKLYVDPTGRDGIEFPTAVGPIDILAIDDGGAFFVFELKRARSPDRAIGQVTRYMGWVRQTIGKGRDVNEIIVAREISDGLRYAVSVVPNVTLFEYEVEFRLKPVQKIS